MYLGTNDTLSQILYNLGSNAVKYTATGSVVITVSGERLEAVNATLDTTALIKQNKAQRNRQQQPPRRHQWCWRSWPITAVVVPAATLSSPSAKATNSSNNCCDAQPQIEGASNNLSSSFAQRLDWIPRSRAVVTQALRHCHISAAAADSRNGTTENIDSVERGSADSDARLPQQQRESSQRTTISVKVPQSLKSNVHGATVNRADLARSKHARSESALVHAHAHRNHRCKGYRNERMAKGTGLGLSVTKQIVALLQ
eukprot:20602-Heterococcus_DN1.PRE.3